jgi:hypothetical protein
MIEIFHTNYILGDTDLQGYGNWIRSTAAINSYTHHILIIQKRNIQTWTVQLTIKAEAIAIA